MSFAYPVMLDLAGRRCLVVGGGPVAERKIDGLLAADARVTVVSPSLTPALLTLAAEARLHWRPREYVAGDAAGVAPRIGATPEPSGGQAVTAGGRERGIRV